MGRYSLRSASKAGSFTWLTVVRGFAWQPFTLPLRRGQPKPGGQACRIRTNFVHCMRLHTEIPCKALLALTYSENIDFLECLRMQKHDSATVRPACHFKAVQPAKDAKTQRNQHAPQTGEPIQELKMLGDARQKDDADQTQHHSSYWGPDPPLGCRWRRKICKCGNTAEPQCRPARPIRPDGPNASSPQNRKRHQDRQSRRQASKDPINHRQRPRMRPTLGIRAQACAQNGRNVKNHNRRTNRSESNCRQCHDHADQTGLRLSKNAPIPSAASGLSQRATRAAMVSAITPSSILGPNRRINALASATAPGAQDK